MNNAINWFEIPTRDMDKAVAFYEKTFGLALKRELFGGFPHAVFAAEGVAGALVSAPHLTPGGSGVVIYLECPDGVTACLARAERGGATVLMPHTHIGENGWIAVIRDLEGNHVGLHSMTRS
jgi:predicted enzyme related to lactoylglutathione lyase